MNPSEIVRVEEETGKPVGFEAALEQFLESIRALQREYFAKCYKSLKPPVISVDPNGQKYLRIVSRDEGNSHGYVYCFVDASNGDILKAAGWKRPAKHARGNIYQNAGKDAITPYGARYLTPTGPKRKAGSKLGTKLTPADKREARILLDVRAEIEGRK